MPRKNHRNGRTPQARRKTDGSTGGRRTAPPPPPLSELVIPKGKCYWRSRKGKMIFTQAEAQKALQQAQQARQRTGSAYAERRAYPCPEGGCGGYHLTSRETYQEKGGAA